MHFFPRGSKVLFGPIAESKLKCGCCTNGALVGLLHLTDQNEPNSPCYHELVDHMCIHHLQLSPLNSHLPNRTPGSPASPPRSGTAATPRSQAET